MDVLVVGALKGSVNRLKGLVDVSDARLVFVLAPMSLKSPLELNRKWFYVHGGEEDFDNLSASDGINISARIIQSEGITFCGLGGIIHPQTVKFTRSEWTKIKGRFGRKYMSYVFAEDLQTLEITSKSLDAEKISIFLTYESPEKPEVKRVIESLNPGYIFYPSGTFSKRVEAGRTYIGLEDAESPRGKYLLRL